MKRKAAPVEEKAKKQKVENKTNKNTDINTNPRDKSTTESTPTFAEDEFFLSQAKVRAIKRLKEDRAKPIDYLYLTVKPSSEIPVDTVIYSPLIVLENLSGQEISELSEDINSFVELDPDSEFWKCLYVLVGDKQARDKIDRGAVVSSVVEDIELLLKDKSESELNELEDEVKTCLESSKGTDEEYWQTLLSHIKIKKASAKFENLHKKLVEERVKIMKDSKIPKEKIENISKQMSDNNMYKSQYQKDTNKNEKEGKQTTDQSGRPRKVLTEHEMYELEEAKGMEEDEELFSQEFILPDSENNVGLKKPKYYNRVKSGVEWNKYNLTHFSEDSPPPKIVLGYKFSIFYPELVGKTTKPSYKLSKTENPDLKILHFTAGPPYKDIAFKIWNGEWEQSQKSGFRCTFSNGILHLWFNFKRFSSDPRFRFRR